MLITENEQKRLIEFLQQSLIEQYDIKPCTSKDIAEYTVKCLLGLVGASAGFPILNATRKYAGNNVNLANLYTYGFIISLGALNIWGLFDFLKYSSINSDVNSEKSFVKKSARIIASVTLAVTTATMGTFINYWYNQNLLLTGQGFICDSILLSCTYQRMLNSRISIQSNQKQTIILGLPHLLLEHLFSGIKHLATLDLEERNQFFIPLKGNLPESTLEVGANFQIAPLRQGIYLLLQYSNRHIIHKEKYLFWTDGLPRTLTKFIISPSVPLIWAGISSYASTKGANNIINNWYVSELLTSPGVILSYILDVILTKAIILFIYDTIISLAICSYQRNIPTLYYPVYQTIASVWGLFTAAFSFSTRAQVVKDFVSPNYNYLLIPFIIAITILLKSSAMQSLIYDFVHFLVRKFSSDDIKDLAKLTQAVEKLEIAIELATPGQIETFINDLNIEQLITHTSQETRLYRLLDELKLRQENQIPLLDETNTVQRGNIFRQCVDCTFFRCRKRPSISNHSDETVHEQTLQILDDEHTDRTDNSFSRKAFCIIQ